MRRGLDRCREDGFSLVEIVIALGIGAVVMQMTAFGISGGLRGASASRNTVQATGLAREVLDTARGYGWTGLAHRQVPVDAGDPYLNSVNQTYDPDGAGGTLGAESLVVEGSNGMVTYPGTFRVGVSLQGLTFTVRTFVTWNGPDPSVAAKRITAIVTWPEGSRTRSLRLGSLVSPVATVAGAAAYLFDGTVGGAPLGKTGYSQAPASGGTQTQNLSTFSVPPTTITGSGGSTSASVVSGFSAYAVSSVSSMTIGLSGLSVSMSGVSVMASSTGAGTSTSGSGTVTINGVPYVNPGPNTSASIPGWNITLNRQRTLPDGTIDITFVVIAGTITTDQVTACWAWVQPVS